MAYIRKVLGDIDIEAAQNEVFDFDWRLVDDLAPRPDDLPSGREAWLTSFWGFNPDRWGCIGFSDEAKRNRFLRETKPGVLVAIYVTKNKGSADERGKVIGVMEISHEACHAQQFISGDAWARKENDPESRGKWLFALRATRAWRIAPEDWRPVAELLPETYGSADPQFIGAAGVAITTSEIDKLLEQEAYETPVYGSTGSIDASIMTLETAITPSRAIPPSAEPYVVGESDGPKHLYILKLEGEIASYLGRAGAAVDGKWIIKVGFSKSPLTRRDQIQSAYPRGSFRWEVLKPQDTSLPPPYSNAAIAIAGEDMMKKRLVDENAEALGGEFFLADEWLVHSTWAAGRAEADNAEKNFQITETREDQRS
ncbi:hypothetical protein C1707_12835 [Caulobacter flavus]|nr:hypothetical protein C1707_12835 [Caulobacter flavus]